MASRPFRSGGILLSRAVILLMASVLVVALASTLVPGRASAAQHFGPSSPPAKPNAMTAVPVLKRADTDRRLPAREERRPSGGRTPRAARPLPNHGPGSITGAVTAATGGDGGRQFAIVVFSASGG